MFVCLFEGYEIFNWIMQAIFSVEFSVDPNNGASISGGPLSATYKLDHFDLHWGSRNGQGSEHKIDENGWVKTKPKLRCPWFYMKSFQVRSRAPVNSLQVLLRQLHCCRSCKSEWLPCHCGHFDKRGLQVWVGAHTLSGGHHGALVQSRGTITKWYRYPYRNGSYSRPICVKHWVRKTNHWQTYEPKSFREKVLFISVVYGECITTRAPWQALGVMKLSNG